jgi:hypothetical protein
MTFIIYLSIPDILMEDVATEGNEAVDNPGCFDR